jgi:hypothetical protein
MVTRPVRRSKFWIALIAAAFVAVFVSSLATASANSSGHGGTSVWFKDATIGPDDVVDGDLNIVFGSVTCEAGGTILGNVQMFGGKFEKLEGCQVAGTVSDALSTDAIMPFAPITSMPAAFDEQNERVLKKLAWDVVVLFAFLLFPVRVRVALDRVELHPGLSFAAGTLALVGAIPIAILLLISVIGLPLIPLEFAALFAGLWIGNAAVALLIGRRLYELLRPHSTPSPLGALALGLVVITAAETLPIVGWAVTALVVLVGLGSAMLAFVRETSFRSFTGRTTVAGAPPGSTPMNGPA